MPTSSPLSAALPPAPSVTGFALRLLLCYGLLHALYFMVPIPVLQDSVYPALFGHPTAAVIGWLAPDEAVTVLANRLSSPRAALDIVRGCDGSGVLFLVAAAVLAFPAGWRARISGVLLGALLVYGLNLVRLGGLYFIAAYHKSWFQPLHTYFIPTLLIVLVALFYLRWLAHVAPDERA